MSEPITDEQAALDLLERAEMRGYVLDAEDARHCGYVLSQLMAQLSDCRVQLARVREALEEIASLPVKFVREGHGFEHAHIDAEGYHGPAVPKLQNMARETLSTTPSNLVVVDREEWEAMRAALGHAALPLEVLAGQIQERPYRELTGDLQDSVLVAVEAIRGSLGGPSG
jgi:hypothetical protein